VVELSVLSSILSEHNSVSLCMYKEITTSDAVKLTVGSNKIPKCRRKRHVCD